MRLLAEIKESNELILEVDVVEGFIKKEENARLISYYRKTSDEKSNNNSNEII